MRPRLAEFHTESKRIPIIARWIACTAIYLSIAASVASVILNMLINTGIGSVFFFSAMTTAILIWTWSLEENATDPSESKTCSESKKFLFTERGRWFGVLIVAIAIATSTVAQFTAPLGKIALARMNVGGGLPIRITTTAAAQVTGALILKAADGWYVRDKKQCDTLVRIASHDMKQYEFLPKTKENLACPN
jgi:hypothetical protein